MNNSNHRLFLGKDSNAQIETAHEVEEGEIRYHNVGIFGINTVDKKGMQLQEFIRTHALCTDNTFFKARKYATHKSFNKLGSTHQIVHFL